MGIKNIYGQLGPGDRVSLTKLAADSYREKGRPLRLAIDFSIWQFQAQAARGGTNPAVRTLFYRLVRLQGIPVQPVLVFDGPQKPVFKRNKRSGRGDGVAIAQAKRLIRLFGFPVHDAPGEAEAECALMQRRGMVDAVLSEDVDTIMFGCSRTLRNWSSEGRGSKAPTHVSLYDVNAMKMAEQGLDREGMILVALMSGGDYNPEGIPGCGVKVACEAAKAGYGKTLCRLKGSDTEGLRKWRESLAHELHTNESGYFRTKHKALSIPDDFPNLEILRYYTHPVVSPESVLESLQVKLDKGPDELHLDALREFARETFSWDYRIGAVKFIRVLAAALLVRKMQLGAADDGAIQRIASRRTHFSTDGESELRLSFVPQDIVPIDLSQEVDEEIPASRDGLALNSDEEVEDVALSSSQLPKEFDVTKPDLAWVLEGVVKSTTPRAFAVWEEAERAKAARKSPSKKTAPKPRGTKKKAASTGMPRGAIEGFVRVTKTSALEKEASTKSGGGPAAAASSAASKKSPPKSRTPRAPSPKKQTSTSSPASRAPRSPSPKKSKKTPASSPAPSLPPLSPPSPPSPPPREPSKPSEMPAGPSDLEQHPADFWTSPRSQFTPTRTPKRPHRPEEPIVISSSPAGEASPPPPRRAAAAAGAAAPPTSTPAATGSTAVHGSMPPPSGRQKVPSPVLPRHSPGQAGKVTSRRAAAPRRPTTTETGSPTKTSRYKQTSMDMFMRRPGISSSQDTTLFKDDESGILISSSPPVGRKDTAPASVQDRDPFVSDKEHGPTGSEAAAPATSDARGKKKKRILVPRAIAIGFFEEIEVDEDLVDETVLREEQKLGRQGEVRGVSRGVSRYSDVSIIDLTQQQ